MERREKRRKLLTDLKLGREEAFREIYRRYCGKLIRFAGEYIMDEKESENIVQNVFLKLWENKSKLREDSNLNAWLFTVTRHNCLSYLAHQRIVRRHMEEVKTREMNLNYLALNRLDLSFESTFEIEDILRQTLENLPEKCREVFEKSRFGNKTNREISEEMGISVKSVEAYMTTAIKSLRTAFSAYLKFMILLLPGFLF